MIRKTHLKGFVWASAVLGMLVAFIGAAAAAESGGIVETEDGFYYTVQKGDTLWGLSQRFSTTPWVWPELWKENEQIANPHLIYPGQRIRLVRKAEKPQITAEKHLDNIYFYYSSIDHVGFIRKVPVTPLGTIFKSRDQSRNMISTGDIVYIRHEGSDSLNPGELFSVYRTFDPILDKTTKEVVGTQHLLCGVLKITQKEPDYAIATVTSAYRPIQLGDLLMPFNHRTPRIPIAKSQPGIDGRIIISEEHLDLFAESYLAFIDRGRIDGIQPGQIYSVYYRDEHQLGTIKSPKRVFTPVDIGELVVLHVEDNNATVLITDSEKEFEAGARVRTPLSSR